MVARDADWDRAETDYLLSLCEQFDLRFLVIADRYEASLCITAPLCCCCSKMLIPYSTSLAPHQGRAMMT